MIVIRMYYKISAYTTTARRPVGSLKTTWRRHSVKKTMKIKKNILNTCFQMCRMVYLGLVQEKWT